MVTAIRLGALALGVSCAGLGAFGAYEFALRLEGGVSYVVLAAPLIAVTAALIPPIAEASWRGGHALKALLWWAVLAPAAVVVFFSSSERVYVAKAGAQTERSARIQHSAGSEAVRSCLQDQARGRSGGKHRRGIARRSFSSRRRWPPRTA